MDIAIIGMAGRFPKSRNTDEFWQHILNGDDCITRGSGAHDVNAYGSMEQIYAFDRKRYHISEADALRMEPQERLMLQCVEQALFHAGLAYANSNKVIGLICGEPENEYDLLNRFYGEKKTEIESQNEHFQYSGGAMAGRIAYLLNLKGPAIKIDTACSTSLSSVILAADMIENGYADVMVAGGSNVSLRQEGYIHIPGMSSADGYVRPFDQNSSGMVPANGVGAVVLKRYNEAVRDGNRIYAVIKGGFITNDGSDKIGYTAPSVDGESRALRGALQRAGIRPDEVDYIETHGTATTLGDAIELRALKQVFPRDPAHPLYIGSLKANFGHMNAAAGISSVIKGCLMLHHEVIPPLIHHRDMNAEVSAQDGICAPHEMRKQHLQYVGISSFGLGGMNAHMILSYVQPQTEKVTNPQLTFDETEYITECVKRCLSGTPEENSAQATPAQNHIHSQEEIASRILAILAEQTGMDDIAPDDTFDENGVVSMDQIVLSAKVSEEFSVSVSIEDLYQYDTVTDLAAYIFRNQQQAEEEEQIEVEEYGDIDELFANL